LIKIIEALIGLQNCSHITLQGLNDRFSPSELYGKLLNTFSDLPSTPIEGASMFKSVVSGDAITVERKNRDSFSFIPTIKLLFSTNAMPQNINEKNDGFYRRLLIIRFLKQVETGKIITDLAEQLKDENDGIFLWGIKGLRRLINNNFQFSSASAIDEEVGKYKLNQNSALLFVDEECQLGSYYSILREDFYTFYEDYCKASGLKAFSKIRFNEAIQQEFSGKILKTNDSITRKAIWRGVRHNYLSSCRKDITDICLETLNDREAFLN
jgi:putative DNA primase/helicase